MRRARGLSQQDLAKVLSLSPRSVDAIERGSQRASAKQLFEIADALDFEIKEFFSQEVSIPLTS